VPNSCQKPQSGSKPEQPSIAKEQQKFQQLTNEDAQDDTQTQRGPMNAFEHPTRVKTLEHGKTNAKEVSARTVQINK